MKVKLIYEELEKRTNNKTLLEKYLEMSKEPIEVTGDYFINRSTYKKIYDVDGFAIYENELIILEN